MEGQEPDTGDGQEPTPPQPKAEGQASSPTFDQDYVKKLRDEAASYRTKLKEIEDRDKSETQKAADEAEAARKRAETAETKLLRFEVAAAKGLPPKWAPRLSGSTKEELEKDADELLKEVTPTPDFGGGPRGESAGGNDMDSLMRRASGRPG